MRSEPGRASMAEQVAWTAASFPRYSAARAFDAAMDAHRARAERLAALRACYDHNTAIAKRSLMPEGLEGAEGRSGATDQGEPGRTLAAACPSQIIEPRLVTCAHYCGRVSMLEPQYSWWVCADCMHIERQRADAAAIALSPNDEEC